MIIESVNQDKEQVLGLKADISQRFDTQIHVLDELTNRRNLDQQNLKELIEDRNTQQQVDMKVTTSELEQTNTRQPISRIQTCFINTSGIHSLTNHHHKWSYLIIVQYR